MAATGSAKAESVAAAPSYPSTGLRRFDFFAYVELSRQRLVNHPGHDQKSHGRKKGAGDKGVPDGGLGPQTSKLGKVSDPGDIRAQAAATNPKNGGPYEGPLTAEIERAGGASYATNCTRVAIAYELRRRGVDVTAGATTPGGDTTVAYVRTFREGGKYPGRVEDNLSRNMSARDINAEVQTWPRGGRGIVTMQGHTVNVERDAKTGKTVFVDAQSTRQQVMTPAAFTSRAQARGASTDQHMAVARVDDLGVSDYSLRYVESPGLSIGDGQVGKTRYPQEPGRDNLPSAAELAAMKPDDTYP